MPFVHFKIDAFTFFILLILFAWNPDLEAILLVVIDTNLIFTGSMSHQCWRRCSSSDLREFI